MNKETLSNKEAAKFDVKISPANMKKLSEIYKELGIDFTFPIKIINEKGNRTYCEYIDGSWWRYEYDENGNDTYYEDSDGYWARCEYEENAKRNGKQTYYENIYGTKQGAKRDSCSSKVVEIDGKKYKLTEL